MNTLWSFLLFSFFIFSYQLDCFYTSKHVYYPNPNNETEKIEVCICPIDYKGNFCNSMRKSRCTVNLLSPEPDCSKYKPEIYGKKEVEGDFPCFFKNSTLEMKVETKIECSFVENQMDYSNLPNTTFTEVSGGRTYDNLQQIFESFKYFLRAENETFALSLNFTYPFTFRPINFYEFGTDQGSTNIILTEKQILGQDKILYTLPRNLKEDFTPGNRIYLEIGFSRKPQEMSTNIYQMVIEMFDKTEPDAPFDWYSLIYWITVPSVSVIISLVVIGSIYLLKPEKYHDY